MGTAATPQTKEELVKIGRTGFSAGTYTLDLSAVQGVPMKVNGQPSTFVDVYCKLRDSKIKGITSFRDDTYVTEEGEIRLDGEIGQWPLKATMRELAELLRQGIDPHHVTWFYYDHDWSRDADESYTFFCVHGGNLFRNRAISAQRNQRSLSVASRMVRLFGTAIPLSMRHLRFTGIGNSTWKR